MQEEFLNYIWKFRLFDGKDLLSSSGEPIEIVKVGEPNSDSGPDFFNAKIKIGKTLWAGNVEIHTRASDWEAHEHQHDQAYDNVILHVVNNADKEIKRKSGEIIPTLELSGRIPKDIYEKYLTFKTNKGWIPCEKQINRTDSFTLQNWLDRLLIERLERKSSPILECLKQNKNNWEETFYQFLGRAFGLKINSEPFEQLTRAVPLSVLLKHKDNLLQLEALLFGTAGLLENEYNDDYPKQLQKEFKFLKSKFKLKAIDASLWKFMRLHPPNFPTIRISQFADLIYRTSSLFSKIIEGKDPAALLTCETSEYWLTHYRFDKPSPKRRKKFGPNSINNITINTLVPFIFIYGKQKGEEEYTDRALALLEKTALEKNAILDKWHELGVKAKNAYDTQALLQLKNEYCAKKRCLDCAIGSKLLQPKPVGV